ncbi:MAG: hypothetical protein ABIS07_00880 [Dokdonella sp.]
MSRVLLSLLFCSASACCHGSPVAKIPWFAGFWQLTSDEDGSPYGYDLNEFRADGRYVIYGPNCEQSFASYHVYNENIYITFDVPGKGPIAMISPTKDHRKLIYTSPRTRNNAGYERDLSPKCRGK